MDARFSGCINFDWTAGYLPGIPSSMNKNDIFNVFERGEKRDSFDSQDSSETDISSHSGHAITPTGRLSPDIISINEPQCHDKYPSLSRWSISSIGSRPHADYACHAHADGSPYSNLEDHPRYLVSPSSRNKMRMRLHFKPRSLLKKFSRRNMSKSSNEIEQFDVAHEHSPLRLTNDPLPPSEPLLNAPKSLPEMSSPKPYISKPLPPIPKTDRHVHSSTNSSTFAARSRTPVRTTVIYNEEPLRHSHNKPGYMDNFDGQFHHRKSSDDRPHTPIALPVPDDNHENAAKASRSPRMTPLLLRDGHFSHDFAVARPVSGSVCDEPGYVLSAGNPTDLDWQHHIQGPPSPPPELDASEPHRSPSEVFQHDQTVKLLGSGSRRSSDIFGENLRPASLIARITGLEQANSAMRANLASALDRLSVVEPLAIGLQDRLTEVEKGIRASCITRLNQRSAPDTAPSTPPTLPFRRPPFGPGLVDDVPVRQALVGHESENGPKSAPMARQPASLIHEIWSMSPLSQPSARTGGISDMTTFPATNTPFIDSAYSSFEAPRTFDACSASQAASTM